MAKAGMRNGMEYVNDKISMMLMVLYNWPLMF